MSRCGLGANPSPKTRHSCELQAVLGDAWWEIRRRRCWVVALGRLPGVWRVKTRHSCELQAVLGVALGRCLVGDVQARVARKAMGFSSQLGLSAPMVRVRCEGKR